MDSFALLQNYRFSTTDRWSRHITALAFLMRISHSLFCLPSLANETPRYLNISDCFSGAPPIWREHCFGCLDRHKVSVFVVLIFFPATEHASENLSRALLSPFFWIGIITLVCHCFGACPVLHATSQTRVNQRTPYMFIAFRPLAVCHCESGYTLFTELLSNNNKYFSISSSCDC